MDQAPITMRDILIQTHSGLERQGPGSAEMTLKALSFVEHADRLSRVADLGCGTGGQTMILAQHIAGSLVGIDQSADFIDIFNDNAKRRNLQDRVKGMVGAMENLSFQQESLDLIWSEGAIDSIGFERGLAHWHGFLKQAGYVVVSCPSWLTEEIPAEVDRFRADAGSRLDTIERNRTIMQQAGYRPMATFALPEDCWTEHYFTPRTAAESALREQHPGNETVEAYIESSHYEVALYAKYKQFYGYVFYIGKKL